MSKLYFITHPSVLINKSQPINQWGLSDQGFEEIDRLLEFDFWKEVESIYTSPEKKAIQVAKIVAERRGVRVNIQDCLSEVDRSSTGYVEYDKYMEMMKLFYNNPAKNILGWENATNATKRIITCIDLIISESKDQTVAVIGHGATGTLLACSLLNKAPNFVEDPQGTGRYMIIDWDKRLIRQKWLAY